MKNRRDDKSLISKLSILAVGQASQDEVSDIADELVESSPRPVHTSSRESRTSKKDVMRMIGVDDLDLDDIDQVDNFFKEAADFLDTDPNNESDDPYWAEDIAGNVDLAIDLIDDTESDWRYKNELIGSGRKYARTATQGNDSEVNRAFAAQESAILDLLRDIEKDKSIVAKELDYISKLRTRNFKSVADLMETKATLHGTTLQAIKELNSMTKTQFDIKAKMKVNDTTEADDVAARTLQSIFGMGRNNLIGSIGGASMVAGGASEEEEYVFKDDATAEDLIKDVRNYSSSDDELYEMSGVKAQDDDGAKFIKYEDRNVDYVVNFKDNGEFDIWAEDEDGNIIEDYPLPSTQGLTFTESKHSAYAVDQLQRKYKVRHEN